jgi:ketosteroid isomerase-like protein
MSEENVEVIREAFERWNRRDIGYWIEHADPEVEVWSKYAALDEGGGPYRGHAGMREWQAEIDRNFEFHEVRADDFRSRRTRAGARLHPVYRCARVRHPSGCGNGEPVWGGGPPRRRLRAAAAAWTRSTVSSTQPALPCSLRLGRAPKHEHR